MSKLLEFFHKYFIILVFVYFLSALLLFKNDYFFGDSISSTSRLTNHIYDSGELFYEQGFDPGHPPTYSILLAYTWKIFGKSLFISHLYGITFCVFLFIGFRKLSGLFLDREHTNYAS